MADLGEAEWSFGWVSALDREARTIWILLRADEMLTAFLELEAATRTWGELS